MKDYAHLHADAVLDDVADTLAERFGDRMCAEISGDGFDRTLVIGIDPIDRPPEGDDEDRDATHHFAYTVVVGRWGSWGFNGRFYLKAQYGTGTRRAHGRGPADGTFDAGVVVLHCLNCYNAHRRERAVEDQKRAWRGLALAVLDAADLDTGPDIGVTDGGDIRVAFTLPRTVDLASLRELVLAGNRLRKPAPPPQPGDARD